MSKGYTKIQNDIAEALIKAELSGGEYQIALFIIRKTLGFQKEKDLISLSQFQEISKKSRSAICKIIKKLTNKNIVIKERMKRHISKYGINFNYATWNNKSLKYKTESVNKMTTTSKPMKNELVNSGTISSEQNDNKLVNKKTHTILNKETITKGQNLKEERPGYNAKATRKFLDDNPKPNKPRKGLKETLRAKNLDEWLAKSAKNKKPAKNKKIRQLKKLTN